MNIIGISGKIGSGKTTLTEHLLVLLGEGWKRIGFGDILKAEVAAEFNFPTEWCYTSKDNLVDVDHPEAPCYKMSVRRLLQWYGTGICRKSDSDYWCCRMTGKLVDLFSDSEVKGVVIDDVRFLNEAQLVKSHKGVLIRIEVYGGYSYGAKEVAEHASETDLDNCRWWDHVLNPEFGQLAEAAKEVHAKICLS